MHSYVSFVFVTNNFDGVVSPICLFLSYLAIVTVCTTASSNSHPREQVSQNHFLEVLPLSMAIYAC